MVFFGRSGHKGTDYEALQVPSQDSGMRTYFRYSVILKTHKNMNNNPIA